MVHQEVADGHQEGAVVGLPEGEAVSLVVAEVLVAEVAAEVGDFPLFFRS